MTVSKINVFKSWLKEKRPELIKVFLGYPLISKTQRRKENWKKINQNNYG